MPHVYDKVLLLERTPKVGDTDCVDLIKHYVPSLRNRHTSTWKKGQQVLTAEYIRPGTVIATFVCGRYPPKGYPNKHVAFFVRFTGKRDKNGNQTEMEVMDQWKGPLKPKVSKRLIQSDGPLEAGECRTPEPGVSNNLDSYYIVE